jgi:hypothetical protein
MSYAITAAFVKTSVALVLFRINVRPMIRNIIIALLTIFWIVSLMLFLFLAFQCRPISLNWGVGEGTCVDVIHTVRLWIAFTVADIACNWILSLLPIAMLWKVQIQKGLKAVLMLLLGMGIVYVTLLPSVAVSYTN